MKFLFTCWLLCLSHCVLGQSALDYPYNPDANSDNAIGAPDLLELLPLFGSYFQIDSISIDGQSLDGVLAMLAEQLEEQQILIQQLQAQLNDLPPTTEITEVTEFNEINHFYGDGLPPQAMGSLVLSSAAVGAPFCLEDANLVELGLVGQNLTGACLPGCFLPCAEDGWPVYCWGEHPTSDGDWSGYDFSGGNFSGSYWGGIPDECGVGSLDLTGGNWNGANLQDAKLGSNGTNFSSSNFQNANLQGAYFQEWFSSSDFTNANLRGVTHGGGGPNSGSNWDCENCEFQGADLSFADLRWADLSSANLAGANLTGTLISPLSGWSCPSSLPDGYVCTGGQGNGPIEIFLTDSSGITPPPAPCSDVSHAGHVYEKVRIGSSCWFKENLRSLHFLDGSPIPVAEYDSQWNDMVSNGQAVVAGNYAGSNHEQYQPEFGRLYSLSALINDAGLCPAGHHVADRMDLMELFEVSASIVEIPDAFEDSGGGCNYNLDWEVAIHLFESDDWPSPDCYFQNNSTGASFASDIGFNALPSGHIQYNGIDVDIGESSSIWVADGEDFFRFQLESNGQDYCYPAELGSQSGQWGAAIRCVQDEE